MNKKLSREPRVSYEEYLRQTKQKDSRDVWMLWLADCYGLTFSEAAGLLDDPVWGYKPLSEACRN